METEEQSKREQILDEVKGIICKDRNEQHGEPDAIFRIIATYWTTYMEQRVEVTDMVRIEPHDVAAMMTLFKLARHGANPAHHDTNIDTVGYAAIMGELSQLE